MEDKYESLEKEEIVSIKEPLEKLFLPHTTFKVSELINTLGDKCLSADSPAQKWFRDAVECEILTPGKNWRTGRVRLSLEFLPDKLEIEETPANNETKNKEPESPLDDLRQMMNQENS
jgi:hypothetical protein